MAHIARAALESIAFQSAALLQAMSRDAWRRRRRSAELRVDGGACVNDLLMQFQADLLGIPVVRPEGRSRPRRSAPPTWPAWPPASTRGLDELAAQWRVERRFLPTMPRDAPPSVMARWEHAVRQATAS